ncbi:hypothetical protein [Halogeometricum limi]|uniref:Uncharacterized protein n=1 Tax=Halogeometricum limi TaxID=555875 RepID=A0A1I6G304_9EURY|nr:hypothetical protein [Halogeometricum limi]SFR36578.1 hypothetical protein SAMN04488124_0789 [Halogeometricum limi]
MGCDNEDSLTHEGETEASQTKDQSSDADATGKQALGTLGSGSATEDEEQFLTIRSTGDGVATFEATVDGRIKSATDLDAILPGLGKSVEDAVSNEERQYILYGGLTNVRINGPAAAFLDGERVA